MPTARAMSLRTTSGNSGFFSLTTARSRSSASSRSCASLTCHKVGQHRIAAALAVRIVERHAKSPVGVVEDVLRQPDHLPPAREILRVTVLECDDFGLGFVAVAVFVDVFVKASEFADRTA